MRTRTICCRCSAGIPNGIAKSRTLEEIGRGRMCAADSRGFTSNYDPETCVCAHSKVRSRRSQRAHACVRSEDTDQRTTVRTNSAAEQAGAIGPEVRANRLTRHTTNLNPHTQIQHKQGGGVGAGQAPTVEEAQPHAHNPQPTPPNRTPTPTSTPTNPTTEQRQQSDQWCNCVGSVRNNQQ